MHRYVPLVLTIALSVNLFLGCATTGPPEVRVVHEDHQAPVRESVTVVANAVAAQPVVEAITKPPPSDPVADAAAAQFGQPDARTDKLKKERDERASALHAWQGAIAEARSNLPALAQSIANCPGAGLPPTSRSVPPTLASVSGMKYQSSGAEWGALGCGTFQLPVPQWLRYEWERKSPTTGVVRGQGDLGGWGKPDLVFDIEVHCADTTKPPKCSIGLLETRLDQHVQ
jgi:hypothetical protein